MNNRTGPIAAKWGRSLLERVGATKLIGNPESSVGPAVALDISDGLVMKAGALACTILHGPSSLRILDADASLVTDPAAQPWFPTNGAAAVTASKTYAFSGVLFFTATNVAISVLFGGTATTSSITYRFLGQRVASAASNATQSSGWLTGTTLPTTSTTATNANTGAGWIQIEGVVRVTGTGTLIPQLAVPLGASTAYANSWFGLVEIDSSSFTTRGTWS